MRYAVLVRLWCVGADNERTL